MKEFERLETKVTSARANSLVALGRAHLAQGEPAKAMPLLEQADVFWGTFDRGSPSAAAASQWLVRARAASRG